MLTGCNYFFSLCYPVYNPGFCVYKNGEKMDSDNYPQDLNNGKNGKKQILFMVFFYVLFGVAAIGTDLYVNDTNYSIPELNQILIAISTGVLISCVNILITRFTDSGRKLSRMIHSILGPVDLSLSLLLVSVGAVAEELMFRALFLNYLASISGPVVSLGLTSLIFGGLHGFFRPPFIFWSVLATLWGLVLGGLMLWTGFIVVPVTVHVIINLTGVLYLKFVFDPEGD